MRKQSPPRSSPGDREPGAHDPPARRKRRRGPWTQPERSRCSRLAPASPSRESSSTGWPSTASAGTPVIASAGFKAEPLPLRRRGKRRRRHSRAPRAACPRLPGFPIWPSVLDRDCGTVSGEPKQADVVGREVARASAPATSTPEILPSTVIGTAISERIASRSRREPSSACAAPRSTSDVRGRRAGDPCSLGELDGASTCVSAPAAAEKDERSLNALDQENLRPCRL